MDIRNVTQNDRAALHTLVRQVNLFEPHEVRVAEEVIDDHLSGSADYLIHLAEERRDATAPQPLGFICHGLNPVTDAVHDVYWIVVDPSARRRGVGRALVQYTEDRLRATGGRAVTIETSSRQEYRAAQGLYEKCGYTLVAEIADFYKPGEAMRTYMKFL